MDSHLRLEHVSAVLAASLRCLATPSTPSLLSPSPLSLFVGVVGLYQASYVRFGVPRAVFLSFLSFGVAADELANGGAIYHRQVVSYCMVAFMLGRFQVTKILSQLSKAGYLTSYKEGRRKYYHFTPRAREKYQALKSHCQDVESRRAAYIREALEILDKKKSG